MSDTLSFASVLDSGVWVSLQAKVDKSHHKRRCEVNALVNSVYTTWVNGTLDKSI